MLRNFKYKCYEVGYTEISEDDCFQETPAPKRFPLLKKQLFGRSTITCFEKLHVPNIFQEEKLLSETVALLISK